MHKNWKNKLLGESITEKGFAAIEIDEREIIGNSEIIYWMFGLIDRVTKEARIFCVLNDRTKNNLLPLVKNNVLSNDMNEFEDDENMEIDEEYQINTRIYSDCYSSYQVNDFRNMGYILKRVNHSIWFGYGSFHTNNVEGLWSQIKRITNNFSGLSINKINQMFTTAYEKKKLFRWMDYICFILKKFRKK